jgi:hypothetical protein
MGAANGNPRSTQFKLENLIGDIPPVRFFATVEVEIVPSVAWLDAHPPDAEGSRPECPPSEAELKFVLCAQALFPSRVTIPADWPKCNVPVGEIHRESMTRVLALMQQQDPALKEPIRALLVAGEKPLVTE